MSITVEERYNGRKLSRGSGANASVEYIIQGTDDDTDAISALVAAAPLIWDDSLPLQTTEVEPLTQTIWLGIAKYGCQQMNPSQPVYNFDTGGGSQHITQSISTTAKYAAPGLTAPDFKGAIGVDDNSVNGVDITVPTYAFSEIHYMPNSAITDAYKSTLFNLTGKVNSGTWRGYNPGEVLFLGVSGSRRGSGEWEMNFKFSASPNITGKVVGDITGIAKKGWEYLWIRYEHADDTTAKVLVKKPTAVFVEKVYEDGNFSGLGV